VAPPAPDLHVELFEHALDAALVTRPDGAILHANPAACALFGYSPEEFRALGRAAVVDPTDPRLAAGLKQRSQTGSFRGVITMVTKAGRRFPGEVSSAVFRSADGEERTSMFIRDISEAQAREDALRASNEQLTQALAEVKKLQGLLPICSYCKRIRDKNDYWQRLEAYITAHAAVQFSHGICPSCMDEHFGGEPGGPTKP